MAYPYYNNYNPYNPYQPYQPYQSQTPPVVNPTSPTPTVTPQSSIIWVASEMEAMSYPIAPNNAVTLWSTTEPVVYLKQADASGKPTMKVYDLVERPEAVSNASGATANKVADYATKEELAAVVGAVRGFDGAIKDIKAEVEKMSGDMYGVVGKKKAAKKNEKEEEEE